MHRPDCFSPFGLCLHGAGVHGLGSGRPTPAPAGTGPGDLQHAVPREPGLCQLQRGGDPAERRLSAAVALLCRSSIRHHQSCPLLPCPREDTVPRRFVLGRRSHGESNCTQHLGTRNSREDVFFPFMLVCWFWFFLNVSTAKNIWSSFCNKRLMSPAPSPG